MYHCELFSVYRGKWADQTRLGEKLYKAPTTFTVAERRHGSFVRRREADALVSEGKVEEFNKKEEERRKYEESEQGKATRKNVNDVEFAILVIILVLRVKIKLRYLLLIIVSYFSDKATRPVRSPRFDRRRKGATGKQHEGLDA